MLQYKFNCNIVDIYISVLSWYTITIDKNKTKKESGIYS